MFNSSRTSHTSRTSRTSRTSQLEGHTPHVRYARAMIWLTSLYNTNVVTLNLRGQKMPIPDSVLFKVLVREIWETDKSMSAFTILDMLIDGELAVHCDNYYFYSDDGKINEVEQFLLDWMPSMKGKEEARKTLGLVARKLSQINSRF
ncbi:MAG: hypothetical protein F6J93_30180 [Oscillatoria sp. SIO1A7]|nr:hypothetical protein [Oscillatoria sp. SIO1A7]